MKMLMGQLHVLVTSHGDVTCFARATDLNNLPRSGSTDECEMICLFPQGHRYWSVWISTTH